METRKIYHSHLFEWGVIINFDDGRRINSTVFSEDEANEAIANPEWFYNQFQPSFLVQEAAAKPLVYTEPTNEYRGTSSNTRLRMS